MKLTNNRRKGNMLNSSSNSSKALLLELHRRGTQRQEVPMVIPQEPHLNKLQISTIIKSNREHFHKKTVVLVAGNRKTPTPLPLTQVRVSLANLAAVEHVI